MEGKLALVVTSMQIAQVKQILSGIKNGADNALRAAINDTLKWGRTAWARQMREIENLPYGIVLGTIKITQNAGNGSLQGVLSLHYEKEPLADFKAKFRRSMGVTVTTIQGQDAHNFRHQFRATMLSGHGGIFQRAMGAGKRVPLHGRYAGRQIKRGPRKGQQILRQPIREAFGPAALTAFERTPEIPEVIVTKMGEKFQERLASKIEWQLAKGTPIVPEGI
jgi:hypothetical protein